MLVIISLFGVVWCKIVACKDWVTCTWFHFLHMGQFLHDLTLVKRHYIEKYYFRVCALESQCFPVNGWQIEISQQDHLCPNHMASHLAMQASWPVNEALINTPYHNRTWTKYQFAEDCFYIARFRRNNERYVFHCKGGHASASCVSLHMIA